MSGEHDDQGAGGASPQANASPAVRQAAGLVVDVFEFVHAGRTLAGDTAIDVFRRLLDGLPPQPRDARVQWAFSGARGPLGEILLETDVSAELVLRCERCLGMMRLPLAVRNTLRVVEQESELDDEATPEADSGYDSVLGSRRFDLLEQVEDELILAVPYVPKHEVCPGDGEAPPPEHRARPSPFAALARLKQDADR